MPLQIELDGLMCHVGDDVDHKEMAVLIDEGAHKPKIFIDKRFRTDDPNNDLDEKLKKGDLVEFRSIDGDSDLPNGPAITTTAFKTLTPDIKRLLEDGNPANIDIDPKVKNKDKDQKIALVYVVYPGGMLDAIDPVDDKLRFTPSSGPPFEMCVADEARLDSTNTKGVIVTVTRRHGGNPLTATLLADAVVRISNRGPSNHFHTYRDLTLAGNMAVATVGQVCDQQAPPAAPVRASLQWKSTRDRRLFTGGPNDPACTNSAWP